MEKIYEKSMIKFFKWYFKQYTKYPVIWFILFTMGVVLAIYEMLILSFLVFCMAIATHLIANYGRNHDWHEND